MNRFVTLVLGIALLVMLSTSEGQAQKTRSHWGIEAGTQTALFGTLSLGNYFESSVKAGMFLNLSKLEEWDFQSIGGITPAALFELRWFPSKPDGEYPYKTGFYVGANLSAHWSEQAIFPPKPNKYVYAFGETLLVGYVTPVSEEGSIRFSIGIGNKFRHYRDAKSGEMTYREKVYFPIELSYSIIF